MASLLAELADDSDSDASSEAPTRSRRRRATAADSDEASDRSDEEAEAQEAQEEEEDDDDDDDDDGDTDDADEEEDDDEEEDGDSLGVEAEPAPPRKPKNPATVPRGGVFYLHDDRDGGDAAPAPGSSKRAAEARLSGAPVDPADRPDARRELVDVSRDSGSGGGRRRKEEGGGDERWCHDKFEELVAAEPNPPPPRAAPAAGRGARGRGGGKGRGRGRGRGRGKGRGGRGATPNSATPAAARNKGLSPATPEWFPPAPGRSYAATRTRFTTVGGEVREPEALL
jgi:hypothetical protein